MKAAAVEAADAIVLQASQQAAAQREADAALHARMQQAEQEAAQIVEAARREAVDEGRRIQDEFDEKARTRDEIERYLGGLVDAARHAGHRAVHGAGRPLAVGLRVRERRSCRSSG